MSTKNMTTIDLTLYTAGGKVRNLSGKDRGLAARKDFDLDTLDIGPDGNKVIIPSYVYAISTSFFCGMFGHSYNSLGQTGLLKKYHFEVSPQIKKQIDQGLERCSYEYNSLL